MPLIAVVDASILVSAFLFPGSIPGRVLKLARQGSFDMHLSPILLAETQDALLSARLRRTYKHGTAEVLTWCAGLRDCASVFDGALSDIGQVCRDPDDDHVLATALAVGATNIVTGDKDLLTLGTFFRVRIVDARSFVIEVDDPK